MKANTVLDANSFLVISIVFSRYTSLVMKPATGFCRDRLLPQTAIPRLAGQGKHHHSCAIIQIVRGGREGAVTNGLNEHEMRGKGVTA
jgi:hypothetical protein